VTLARDQQQAGEVARRRREADRKLREWQRLVRPGEGLGPEIPEGGFQIVVPEKRTLSDDGRDHLRFRFQARRHRYGAGTWSPTESPLFVGPPRSMGEPVETIAEDWFDFQRLVDGVNREAWERERTRREEEDHWSRQREHEHRLLSDL
jgi:hypothetical protein